MQKNSKEERVRGHSSLRIHRHVTVKRTGAGGVSRSASNIETWRVWISTRGSAVVPVGPKPVMALGVRWDAKEEERCWT